MKQRMLLIAVAAALLGFNLPVRACTCAEDFELEAPASPQQSKKLTTQERVEVEKRRNTERTSRLIERAEVIVRGKVLSVRAGEDIFLPSDSAIFSGANSATLASSRAVLADFKVKNVIKGKAADKIKIYTGFGTGDCGIATGLLVAIAWDREVSFAVKPISGVPDAYAANVCGYAEMHESKEQQ